MKIGVLSDTHIPFAAKKLPTKVLEAFEDVNHIIHAGDIMDIKVLQQLEELAAVTAVAGNTDPYSLYEKLGDKKIITLGKFNFGVFHGHGSSGKTLDRVIKRFQKDRVDCIIFGHSHIPYCEYHNGILMFNPGSPTDKRRNEHYSFGIIDIDESISAQIIYF